MATWVILDWFSGQGEPRFDLLTPAGRETHALLARLRTYKRRQLQKAELEDEIATLGPAGDPDHLAELENELTKVRRSLNLTAKMLSVSFGVDVTQRDPSTRYNRMTWEES